MAPLIDIDDEIDLEIIDLVADIGEHGPTPTEALKYLRERIDLMASSVEEFFQAAQEITFIAPRTRH
jgi:exonuclease VII large subunit